MTLHPLHSPNAFRQLMLEWEKFSPYNAGQFVTLPEEFSVDRLSHSWKSLIEKHDLEQLAPMHRDVNSPDVSICQHVTRELNHVFDEHEPPFRPFAIRDLHRTHVGIIYRHAVADSFSIRMLMQGWLTGGLNRRIEFDFRDSHVGKLKLMREVVPEVVRLCRIRRVRRLPRKRYVNCGVTWSMHELGDDLIERLVSFCRSQKATVNDLFVALAARVGARCFPSESNALRTDVGVGSIVDLRDRTQTSFGLSLGFMQTFLSAEDMANRIRAIKVCNSASRKARQRGLVASTRLRLLATLWEHRRLNRNDLLTFYRKRCPLIGGISNVNLSPTDIGKWCINQDALYTRVSPLGPMLPVVFTPTTAGSRLTLGVTTRDRLINPERRAKLISMFIEELNECASLQPVGDLV